MWKVAGAGLVVVLAVGGCGGTGPNADLPELTGVRETGVPPGMMGVAPPDLEQTGYTDAYLAGPHFAVKLAWQAKGPALDEQGAAITGHLFDPQRAADDHELLLVKADERVRSGQWEPDDDDPPVRADLVVDGKATRLRHLPLTPPSGMVPKLDSAAVLASVPDGAPVTLRVTDAGRTQSLDLRTGRRGRDAIPGYYRTNTAAAGWKKTVKAGADVTGGIGHYPMAITARLTSANPADTMNEPSITLAPYTPSRGWARPGRAWLLMPRPAVSTPLRLGITPMYRLKVDDAETYGLTLPDGTREPAEKGHSTVDMSLGDLQQRGGDLAFEVPAGFTSGTFTIDLGKGALRASLGRDGYPPARWSPAPEPLKVPVTFD